MTIKTSLLGGAALSVLLTVAAGASADAKPVKHHHKAVVVHEENESVKAELSQLRAEVETLKAWHDSQAAAQAQADAQVAQLRAQLADSEARAQAAQARLDTTIQTIPTEFKTAVEAATPPNDKFYFKGITITPGGFIAAESLYRSHQEGADIGSSFSGLPLPNVTTAHSSESRFTARQSRLSLLAKGDVSSTLHLTGYYEMDFLGAAQTANSNESNSYTPRVRQLFTTVDWDQSFGKLSVTSGQTWSLLTLNSKGIEPRGEQVPLTIEAQYVVGFNWARQPGVRATVSLKDGLSFAVSAENPQTTFYNSGKFSTGVVVPVTGVAGGSEFNSANTLSLNRYPDGIAKAAYDHDFDGHHVHVEASGVIRDLYAQQTVTAGNATTSDHATGGGVGGGAILGIIPKVLDLQVSGLTGRGIGRYGSGQLPDASFGVNGQIHPIQEWELMFGGVAHVGTVLDVYAYAGEERESAQNYTVGSTFNGIGNPHYDNTGCEIYGNTANCVGNTHYLEQVTAGFWHKPYQGKFGRIQWGVEYSYTERHAFAGYGVTPITGGDPRPVARENIVMTSVRYYPF